MFILKSILKPLQDEFSSSSERADWFACTLLSFILPFTRSRSSNILRSLHELFDLSITQRRFYTFMASPKLPWLPLWRVVWGQIPEPQTQGRILLALDDSITPKSGKKIFACHHFFDHAAKANQSKYPWSQNIVKLSLLKPIHDRWASLPLNYAFYRPKNAMGKAFKTKLEQAVELVESVASTWKELPLLVVTDSWFGNQGLFKPLRQRLGHRVDVLSRLRTNINLFDLPKPRRFKRRGAPRKYGQKRGSVRTLARRLKRTAQSCQVNLYGKRREVQVVSQCFMLKTLKCQVRVVWIYRRTQWVALFTTDLTLSIEQIISTYGARWKIEAAFKELKHDLGSIHCQATTFTAVTNHWHFAMMAMTLAWIYAALLPQKPQHRQSSKTKIHFTFSDLQHLIAQDISKPEFKRVLNNLHKPINNNLIRSILRLAA